MIEMLRNSRWAPHLHIGSYSVSDSSSKLKIWFMKFNFLPILSSCTSLLSASETELELNSWCFHSHFLLYFLKGLLTCWTSNSLPEWEHSLCTSVGFYVIPTPVVYRGALTHPPWPLADYLPFWFIYYYSHE